MVQISPLSKIITLSTVLATGFLLIILSCALWNNWLPLIVVAVFCLAPAPNAICQSWAGQDDFMSESSSTVIDFGRFSTGFMVVSGLSIPVMLAHNSIINTAAMWMSLSGGLLIYATIITFGAFFYEPEEF
ncbi:Vacuolar protein sorting-associated protein 55 [Yarrowia sp. C11]|nr:Vacuolar protein sorting-associated protein 55 [Yarrowia sp. C11]KAG5363819.1 Vacuolar protein sorting-associated protein 55 [Yarrowia sp. B02]KAG5364982.1 Vacuolar protein sorting-associated protein 55 [Yarrowia sp. E02]